MGKRAWIYLINPFEANTRGSHKKMMTLASDTNSKLTAEAADPDITAIKNSYDPVYNAYVQIYGNYDSVAGIRKGKTLNLETIMKEQFPDELRDWETAVRALYPEDSPEEVEIFPNKRSPFLQGTYEDRISAVTSLIATLQADGNFATLITQVQSFRNVLLSARDTQQQKEGLKGQLAALREQQRILLANALYGVMGALMVKFKSTRDQIAHYFDLSLLRSTGEGEEVVILMLVKTVGPASFLNAGAVPEGAQKVRLTLLTNGPIEMGSSADGGLTYNGNTTSTSAINVPVTYTEEDFASIGNILLLHNQNPTLATDCKIEFLA